MPSVRHDGGPSFYRLASEGGWTAEKLDSALRQGHQMSPMILQPDQLKELATYIQSLKR